MVKVRALSKGYVGLVLREAGDVFEWPEDVKLGSWVQKVDRGEPFGGKGDHDGDGKAGGSVPAGGDDDDDGKKAKRGRKGKADTVHQEVAEPFADAPPVRVHNEVNEATGGTAPDWLPPADDSVPVQADD